MSGSEYVITPYLGLYKPAYDADAEYWGLHLNANADTLDNLSYVQGADTASRVLRSGDTMTGGLYLAHDPVDPLEPATRQYQDAAVALLYPSTNPANYQTLLQVQGLLTATGGTALPLMNGVAAIGVSGLHSHDDHVHPTDTSLYPASNPSGFQTAPQVTSAITSTALLQTQLGAVNGVAPLNASGLVASTYLPPTGQNYRGTYNATTNVPAISAGGVGGSKGDYYIVGTAGTVAADSVGACTIGDNILNNGTLWQRIAAAPGIGSMGTQDAANVAITGGTARFANFGLVGSTVYAPFTSGTLPTRSYEYVWYDAAQRVAGGILTDGSLAWGPGSFTTLTAPLATVPHLLGPTLIDTLTAGSFAPTTMTIGGSTLGTLDPRPPGYVYAWHDGTNIAGGIDTAGRFKWGNATIDTLLLNKDPTTSAGAVNKAYFDARAVQTTGATLTGPLLLASDPTSALMAATRSYVDAAAASGGAGGLAGLVSQRDFPYPPLRDPKRDYGALGNGTADDSNAFKACVNAALAAGERAIAVNDVYNVPSIDWNVAQLLLIGTGRLVNAPIQMFVIPPWAPSAPSRLPCTMSLRAHCPKLAAKLRAQQPADAPAVVVITGESTYSPSTNYTVLPIFWARARLAIQEANPGKKLTVINRAIGGTRWSNLDTTPNWADPEDATVSWYVTASRPWLDYIQDLQPDVVMIGFSGNDGIAWRQLTMISVLNKMAAWAKPPEVILATSNPYAQQYLTTQPNTVIGWEGQQAAACMERSWAISKGLGLIDTSKAVTIHAKGFDPDDMPLKRDFVPSGNNQASAGRKGMSLPFTWPTRVWGYGGLFYVQVGGWAALGNEIQFELGMTWGGGTWPNITPNAANAGCILRVGRTPATGQMYYEVDTALTSMGATVQSIHIPKTDATGWVDPNGGDMSFAFMVSGSKLVLQTLSGGTAGFDQWTFGLITSVPRYNQPWFPKITCSAGGTVVNALFFEKAGDGYGAAYSAVPDPRAFFMPSCTEHEAYGGQNTPDDSYGGGGVGHDSSLKGIWALKAAIDSADWSA